MFRSKYGSEYAYEAGADTPTCNKWQVNANLIKCLLVRGGARVCGCAAVPVRPAVRARPLPAALWLPCTPGLCGRARRGRAHTWRRALPHAPQVEPPANDVKVAMLSQIAQVRGPTKARSCGCAGRRARTAQVRLPCPRARGLQCSLTPSLCAPHHMRAPDLYSTRRAVMLTKQLQLGCMHHGRRSTRWRTGTCTAWRASSCRRASPWAAPSSRRPARRPPPSFSTSRPPTRPPASCSTSRPPTRHPSGRRPCRRRRCRPCG